jgi:hypothetical protein
MTDPRPTPDWRPLALTLASVTAAYAVLYRFMPLDLKAYALWPFGAWALYSGARLTTRVALPLTLGVFALTDVVQFVVHHYPPNYVFYLCLAVTVLVGRVLLARSQAAWRVVGGAVFGYAFFFLASNFAAWLEPAMEDYRPYSLQTLLLAYERGLQFVRMQPGQLDFGLILSFGLFGAHAYLAKAYFPAEQVVVAQEVR